MSIDAYNWAWKQSLQDPATKLLLLALADHADKQGQCWPGKKRLAERCETTTRTIRRHLKKLETRGLLRKQLRLQKPGLNDSNLYTLLMEAKASGGGGDSSETGDNGVIDGTEVGARMVGDMVPAGMCVGARVSPKSSSESKKNPQRNAVSISLSFEEYYKSYPKRLNKQAALKEWEKLSLDASLVAHIMKDIENKRESEEWTNDNGRYVPNPVNYLRDRRWEDDSDEDDSDEEPKIQRREPAAPSKTVTTTKPKISRKRNTITYADFWKEYPQKMVLVARQIISLKDLQSEAGHKWDEIVGGDQVVASLIMRNLRAQIKAIPSHKFPNPIAYLHKRYWTEKTQVEAWMVGTG